MTLKPHWRTATAVAVLLFATIPARAQGTAGWKVIAWNDLGMHCMDSDYGVFSILPPFNTVQAQMINASGLLLHSSTGVTLTYEAVADPTGSINRTSIGKSNFWQYASTLYGASSTLDLGLAGNRMPGVANTPQPLGFSAANWVFGATGIPLTPYDDDHHKRPYPMMKFVARNASGTILATTKAVLPVSDEMDCRACHASGPSGPAEPNAGWVFAPNPDRDYRLNILRLHDDRNLGLMTYQAALAQSGYNAAGLEATVTAGTPILCARCHASNALPGTGIAGLPPLTRALHHRHAPVIDPTNNLSLDSSSNRSACYRCHPGSETRCLRGSMGSAVAANGTLEMQCQSCHGSMSVVGANNRQGWLEEPNCQNCHTGTALANNGQIRYTTAYTAPGALRAAVDPTFATTPNVPAAGLSLYRFSAGHGGLRCEACHGSTHAEYPSIHANDNVQSQTLQGHVGVLVECASCHNGSPPTIDGGPHGMHPVGQAWVNDHGDAVENIGSSQCRACHGTDYKGTVLSRAQADRTLTTSWGSRTFWRGAQVSCYACHNGPGSENQTTNHAPIVVGGTATCSTSPVTVNLTATDQDANPLTLRVVSQPANGTVSISGLQATYYPEPGFAGLDTFTFAAWDTFANSNLGVVTINRTASWASFGTGYPGTNGVVPALTASGAPHIASTVTFNMQNTSGVGTMAILVASRDQAQIATNNGGSLLAEVPNFVLVPLGAFGASFAWAIPNDPQMIGLVVNAQSVQYDPGARFQYAFSRGIRLAIGQ